jgi:hypothetical protein
MFHVVSRIPNLQDSAGKFRRNTARERHDPFDVGSIAMNSAVSPDILQDPAGAMFSRPARLSKSYDSDITSHIRSGRMVGIA